MLCMGAASTAPRPPGRHLSGHINISSRRRVRLKLGSEYRTRNSPKEYPGTLRSAMGFKLIARQNPFSLDTAQALELLLWT